MDGRIQWDREDFFPSADRLLFSAKNIYIYRRAEKSSIADGSIRQSLFTSTISIPTLSFPPAFVLFFPSLIIIIIIIMYVFLMTLSRLMHCFRHDCNSNSLKVCRLNNYFSLAEIVSFLFIFPSHGEVWFNL